MYEDESFHCWYLLRTTEKLMTQNDYCQLFANNEKIQNLFIFQDFFNYPVRSSLERVGEKNSST